MMNIRQRKITKILKILNQEKKITQSNRPLTMAPRENKNNAYAKFGGTNKECYGIFLYTYWDLPTENSVYKLF